jgi:Clp amino terminal domain, pathogenicity island component/UvrB/uvrC motif
MFERFTEQSRRVVVVAQEEARELNHNYIGTEHLLLAILRDGRGGAAEALDSLAITEELVRQQVEEIVGRGRKSPSGHIPFTPTAKKTMELSLSEATALGHTYIGPEHLLLGLVRVGEGPATQVLAALGVDPKRVREQVIRQMSAHPGDDQAVPGPSPAELVPRELLSGLRDRIDSLERRLSVLEHRVGTGPGLGQLDRDIAQARRAKEYAIDVQDFENAAAARDRERQLLDERAARRQEWEALPPLSEEIGRLRDLLRRHGIDPEDGAA